MPSAIVNGLTLNFEVIGRQGDCRSSESELPLGLSIFAYYIELKNVIARTAHLKEVMRERKWKVTPRAAQATIIELAHPEVPDRAVSDAA